MKQLNFIIENCFGISKFKETIDFKTCNTVMIYAPNGTMKTSFAKTLQILSQRAESNKRKGLEETICDRLHKDLPVKSNVTLESGAVLKPENIFVANPDDMTFDAAQSVTTFLASTDLKKRYDTIIKIISGAKNNFIKQYKKISQSTDCETELVSVFAEKENSSIYDILDILWDKINNADYPLYQIKFNDIFDKKGAVKDFIEKNMTSLNLFVQRYNELLTKSQFFHISTDGKTTFGTYQAKTLSNGLKDGSFFKVNHKLQLKDNSNIESFSQLNERILEEIKTVESDEKLQATFTKILEKLDSNAELRAFKECIKDNMTILGELQEYEVFKKNVLLGYFSDVETRRVLEDLYKQYSSNKEDLMNIIHEARQEHEKWKNIVDLFNARFYVPFKARIDNQEDIILKQETPKLSFVYKKQTGEDIKQSRDEILKILSKGEMRAFFILQMIFEIEARKEKDEESLIVLDDISDSFDYQNKFAIIEYINDISNSCNDKFKIILLTHNFDFYRNATQRLRIKKFFMATKEKEGNISLHRGPYIMRTPLDNEIKHTNTCNFISMIPFVRNIVEYTEGSDYDDGNGKENNDFMTLTNCLHLLDRTNNLTDIDIDNIIRKHIKNKKYNYITTGTKIIDIIYDEARKIINKEKPEELQIEDKIVLSIAIRLKAETYMRRELLSLGETEESLQSGENQTTKWIDKMRNRLPENTVLKILERVNMMTPECIHINSFMYEPLIDMSIRHLVKLYEDVNDL